MRTAIRKRLPLVILAVVVLIVLFSQRLAVFTTDWWWFREVGASSVFTTSLVARFGLGALGALTVAAIVAANLVLVRRLRPTIIPDSPQQAIIEQYRNQAEPFFKWIIAGVAAVFGLTSGAALAYEWPTYLLWRNGGSFGVDDPQFGRDVGFYVFDLPWWQAMQSWAVTTMVLVGFLCIGGHLLLGGIRPDAARDRVLPQVRTHLALVLVAILGLRAWGYWLDRYELNFSERGTVTGASYTDVNAELPALYLLLVISFVAIVLVAWGARQGSFTLPGIAIGLLVVGSLLLQGAYPAVIQRLRVEPQELDREQPYIEANLAMTRSAYGLTDLDLEPFTITNDLDTAQIEENEATFSNIRLWDPALLQDNYQELQALRPYYEFHDVDIDRYMVDGEQRQVMLSTRELDRDGLQSQWQNERLTFTHGYGVVASQVNTASRNGQPVFLASDIPPRTNPAQAPDGELVPENPALYFAEAGFPDYAILNTDQDELDYERPATQEQVNVNYEGDGGVALGGFMRRVAFGLRFSDSNFVLSNLLNDDSRVTYNRTIAERVNEVAPYLSLDQDPYPVVLEDRVVWVQDAYTTSTNYPYSEYSSFETASGPMRVNYVRNSVKAVVDAYDGSVTLYVVDPDDPVIAAWRGAFDDQLFVDVADAPEELVAHFRYPEDLFSLQTQMYGTYHIPGARAFYNKADQWAIPRDAAALENNPSLDAAAAPLDPYYLVMTLPGETTPEFVLIQPYVPEGKENMIAWMAARSDPDSYGELFAVQFPTDANVLGPRQAHGRIEQESEIAREITLVDQAGSDLIRGNLLVLPVEQSLLYVEPLFLVNPQSQIPELWQVVLVLDDRVVMRPTLPEALEALVESGPPTDDGPAEPDDAEVDDDATAEQLIQQALELFVQADDALAAGDLGEYQALTDQARDLLERAAQLQGLEVPVAEPTPLPGEAPSGSATDAPEALATTPAATEAAGG
ncbi:MAG TPA: UPF0182 family protein [Nitriliruptoraceae bacterium]|nr:UPF0182 family protein [Nitriliruptoraceae bacterium]